MAQGKKLRIAMVATEAVPFAKEGGVADVMGSLPKELAALGHDVRIFLPRYGVIDPAGAAGADDTASTERARSGGLRHQVRLSRRHCPIRRSPSTCWSTRSSLARHQRIYLGQDQRDEQRRFVLFCRGLLEDPARARLRPRHHPPQRLADRPLRRLSAHAAIAICCGAAPAASIYTVHNLQYQGRWDPSILDEAGLDRAQRLHAAGLEFWGDVNWMKAGIIYADAVTTVSRRYAEEIQTLDYGWGLDEVLFQRHARVFGIPNGIDWEAWNPADRPRPGRALHRGGCADGKARNRAALRQEFGLPDEPDVPLIGIVSRLVDQKGFDLMAEIADALRDLPLQLVVLGTGQPRYEQLFRDLSAALGERARAHRLRRRALASHLRRLGLLPDAQRVRAGRPGPVDRPALRHAAHRPRDRRPGRHRDRSRTPTPAAATASASPTTPRGAARHAAPRAAALREPRPLAHAGDARDGLRLALVGERPCLRRPLPPRAARSLLPKKPCYYLHVADGRRPETSRLAPYWLYFPCWLNLA